MTFEEFDACFDRFERSTFRLETLQRYAVPQEDEGFRAFREGTPRPERSVRTNPWLRRVAVTTVGGKQWQRVHIVAHPLTEYLRYEIVSYVESAAAGEEVRIAERAAHPDLATLGPDFWLFDAEVDHAFAILMHYDRDGHVLDFEHTDDPGTLQRCRAQRDLALQHSVGLNTYLATERAAGQVA
jgi:hypothetical protein